MVLALRRETTPSTLKILPEPSLAALPTGIYDASAKRTCSRVVNNSADALLFRVQGSYAAVAEETVGVTSDLPTFVYITFSAAIIELQNQRPGRTVSSVYIPVIMSQQPPALH